MNITCIKCDHTCHHSRAVEPSTTSELLHNCLHSMLAPNLLETLVYKIIYGTESTYSFSETPQYKSTCGFPLVSTCTHGPQDYDMFLGMLSSMSLKLDRSCIIWGHNINFHKKYSHEVIEQEPKSKFFSLFLTGRGQGGGKLTTGNTKL